MAKSSVSVESWLSKLGQPASDRDYRPGHARMRKLLEHLKLTTPRLRIRIAGTNGKGSTAHMLNQALMCAGLRVGLYTSPHIHEFNERIRVNSIPIDRTTLLSGLESLVPVALRVSASYFELATVIALHYFSSRSVDVEILEAGVGARLDATTAVPADMALITPIGLDHQDWLGESLSRIAREKAYAMDGCRWSISAPQTPEVANILQAYNPGLEIISQATDFHGLAAYGSHQKINASLACSAVGRLKDTGWFSIDLARARKAIAETGIPGRMQHVQWGKRQIWLDAAHNEHAIRALLPDLKGLADPFDAIFVFPRPDRNLGQALDLLRPYCRRIITPRWLDSPSSACYETVDEALDMELPHPDHGRYLVLGSFTSVAAADAWLGRQVGTS